MFENFTLASLLVIVLMKGIFVIPALLTHNAQGFENCETPPSLNPLPSCIDIDRLRCFVVLLLTSTLLGVALREF
jgi:hypothetical protein